MVIANKYPPSHEKEICKKVTKFFDSNNGTHTLIGFFPARLDLKERFYSRGVGYMEIVKFAIQEGNKMLHNMSIPAKVRYIFYDTCANSHIARSSVLDLLMDKQDIIEGDSKYDCHCQEKLYSSFLGIVGPSTSGIAEFVSNYLLPSGLPQVSYSATATILNDREKYPNFMRTIPPDDAQAYFILNILQYFKWSYVSFIARDDSYGRYGRQTLLPLLKKHNICIDASLIYSSEVINQTLQALVGNRKANVIIVWTSFKSVREILNNASKKQVFGKIWIFTESTSTHPDVLSFDKKVIPGSLFVVPKIIKYPSFERYFWKLNFSTKGLSPWLSRYYKVKAKEYTNLSLGDMDEKIKINIDKAGIIKNAVFAYFHGLADYLNHTCMSYSCKPMPDIDRSSFSNYLKNAKYIDHITNIFNISNGNPLMQKYDLYTVQFKEKNYFKKIGTWDRSEQLHIIDKFIWPGSTNITPQSVCAVPCHPGYRTVKNNAKPCCWSCVPCQQRYYKERGKNLYDCKLCPSGKYSNANRTSCVPINYKFIEYNSISAQLAYGCVTMGLAFTVFAMSLFVNKRNTPVVKSSHLPLTLTQFISHLLLFFVILFLLGKPNKSKCNTLVILWGIFHTTILAVTFVKTEILLRLFRFRRKLSTSNIRITKTLVIGIITFQTILQFVISRGFFIMDLPDVHFQTLSSSGDSMYITCSYDIYVYAQVVYTLVLSLLCMIQAFRGRRLPHNYNETTFITYAMFSTGIINILMMGVYWSCTNPGVKQHIIGFTIWIDNCVLICTLHGFRIWVILFRPNKNSRAYFTATVLFSKGSCKNKVSTQCSVKATDE